MTRVLTGYMLRYNQSLKARYLRDEAVSPIQLMRGRLLSLWLQDLHVVGCIIGAHVNVPSGRLVIGTLQYPGPFNQFRRSIWGYLNFDIE